MQGIYKIENIVNKKLYIGSSANIERRWTDHIYLLNHNKHHSPHLQSAWNKYGQSAFTFEILEICKKDVLQKEQFYLNSLLKADEYISNINKYFLKLGYNIKPTAQSNIGYKHSQASITKMLKSNNTKSVLSINIVDNSILEFVSTGFAAKFFNIKTSVVRKSIKTGKTPRELNDIGFVYKNDYYVNFKPQVYTSWNKGIKTGVVAQNAKQVFVKNLVNNNIKKFDSIKDCATYYNTSPAFVCKRLSKGDNITFDRKGSRLYKLRFFYTLKKCNDIV